MAFNAKIGERVLVTIAGMTQLYLDDKINTRRAMVIGYDRGRPCIHFDGSNVTYRVRVEQLEQFDAQEESEWVSQ
jgi:hypothetical protein